jgi:methionyl-tRNA formyltransferase
MQCSEVKKFAVEKKIPFLQPLKLKDEDFINKLKDWNADVFVVVAFRMLPAQVYEIAPKGTFNVHASLLPQYRGAAPIHWAIMNGESKTGITTFFLNHEIDCGDIILQREIDIKPNETTGELYERLKKLGATAALETLSLIANDVCKLLPQPKVNAEAIKTAPKIHKEDTVIDWNLPAKEILNKIRGLSPDPGAVTFLKKNDEKIVSLKIFEATILPEKSEQNGGKIITDNKTFINISSKDFYISIQNLQLEGKNKLKTADFISGNKLSNYTIKI